VFRDSQLPELASFYRFTFHAAERYLWSRVSCQHVFRPSSPAILPASIIRPQADSRTETKTTKLLTLIFLLNVLTASARPTSEPVKLQDGTESFPPLMSDLDAGCLLLMAGQCIRESPPVVTDSGCGVYRHKTCCAPTPPLQTCCKLTPGFALIRHMLPRLPNIARPTNLPLCTTRCIRIMNAGISRDVIWSSPTRSARLSADLESVTHSGPATSTHLPLPSSPSLSNPHHHLRELSRTPQPHPSPRRPLHPLRRRPPLRRCHR